MTSQNEHFLFWRNSKVWQAGLAGWGIKQQIYSKWYFCSKIMAQLYTLL